MNFIAGLIGFCIGLIFAFLLSMPAYESENLHSKVMGECQADLPRSQKCIITAVPEVAE